MTIEELAGKAGLSVYQTDAILHKLAYLLRSLHQTREAGSTDGVVCLSCRIKGVRDVFDALGMFSSWDIQEALNEQRNCDMDYRDYVDVVTGP